MNDRDRILVGIIGAPHGIRGEVRLKSYTSSPEAIADYRAFSSKDGRRTLKIQTARLLKDDMLVVRLEGVGDRDAAQALTNLELYIDRAALPPAEEDEFYHADLVGLRAVAPGGETVGTVIAVQNFGAGDLLEIAPERGDTFYVPFTKAFVPQVDPGKGLVGLTAEALPGEDDEREPLSDLDPSADG